MIVIKILQMEDGEAVFYADGHLAAAEFIAALRENGEYREKLADELEIDATLAEELELIPSDILHQHWRYCWGPYGEEQLWWQSKPGRGAKKVTVYEMDGVGLGELGDW